MPRSALASCPGRVPAYAHPTTRSYKGHTPLAALSIRPQEIAQVTSEGAGDSLVLGLGGGGGGATWLWRRAENARDRLAEEKQKTEAALQREAEARQKLAAAEGELEQVLYLQRVARAYQEWR